MLKERERYTTTMVSEEARGFLDAVHHGRMTLAEAREAIGIGRDTEATLRAYVKTLTADERKSMKWPGGIKGFTWITAFSVKDLTFRHRVLRMFERGIAKTGGAGFKPYRRTQIAELKPYVPGQNDMRMVSVSEADRDNGSPKAGDMIARNPKNHADQWLVSRAYFEANFEEM